MVSDKALPSPVRAIPFALADHEPERKGLSSGPQAEGEGQQQASPFRGRASTAKLGASPKAVADDGSPAKEGKAPASPLPVKPSATEPSPSSRASSRASPKAVPEDGSPEKVPASPLPAKPSTAEPTPSPRASPRAFPRALPKDGSPPKEERGPASPLPVKPSTAEPKAPAGAPAKAWGDAEGEAAGLQAAEEGHRREISLLQQRVAFLESSATERDTEMQGLREELAVAAAAAAVSGQREAELAQLQRELGSARAAAAEAERSVEASAQQARQLSAEVAELTAALAASEAASEAAGRRSASEKDEQIQQLLGETRLLEEQARETLQELQEAQQAAAEALTREQSRSAQAEAETAELQAHFEVGCFFVSKLVVSGLASERKMWCAKSCSCGCCW